MIPNELIELNQWVTWRRDEVNGKVPYRADLLGKASVTDNKTWSSYPKTINAVEMARGGLDGIGFVLSHEDPYICIDLDDTGGDIELLAKQQHIAKVLNSYTELSPSGKGVHIWIKGKISGGRRLRGIEIYPHERYVTVTGNRLNEFPRTIEWRQKEVEDLLELMGDASTPNETLDCPQVMTDDEILVMAAGAVNANKFNMLQSGDWQTLYPSQSEADQAYIDIIAFYTQNRAQIIRIFHSSPLGQRDKAKRNDYVTKLINKGFDKITPPVNLDAIRAKLDYELNTPVEDIIEDIQEQVSRPVFECSYPLPNGLLNEIAKYIYESAPRPVIEIALAAAISFMSGLCGRSYNVSGTGLNQYVVLLAETGRGKDAMLNGIDRLFDAIESNGIQSIKDYQFPDMIASPQALRKFFNTTVPCGLSIFGEIGLQFQAWTSQRASPNDIAMRRMLLDLYNKSGRGQSLKEAIYSDKDKNASSVQSPAFSFLGETNPRSFYENITSDSVSEGLLSRLLTIEYDGDRKYKQDVFNIAPPQHLVNHLSALAAHVVMLNGGNQVVDIPLTPEAKRLNKLYDQHTTDLINKGKNDGLIELWNRADLKSLKLAALYAISKNYIDPVIDEEAYLWATAFVDQTISTFKSKIELGVYNDAADEDERREYVLRVFKRIHLAKVTEWKNATVSKEMVKDCVVPYKFIVTSLSNLKALKDKDGLTTPTVKKILAELVEMNTIVPVSKADMLQRYDTSQQGYIVVDSHLIRKWKADK